MLFVCCWSGVGKLTGMLTTGIEAGIVGVGAEAEGLPLRHHLRTSLTLATTESSSGSGHLFRRSESKGVPKNIVSVEESVSVSV